MKCKKCETACPEIMPVNGPKAWGLDKETFEPICPTCLKIEDLEWKLAEIGKLCGHRCELFSTRETVTDALLFASQIASSSAHPPAVLTAVFVVLNTVLNKVAELVNEEV